MSDERQELAELEELDRLEKKAAGPAAPEDSFTEQAAKKFLDIGGTVGKAALQGAANVGEKIDRYTGAPIRSAVGALQEGQGLGGAASAYGKQFGAPSAQAPTGEQLMQKAGVSDKSFSVPLIKNPWGQTEQEKYIQTSPAELTGTAAQIALDPTTYIAPEALVGGASKAAEASSGVAPKVAEYLAKQAELRSAKAMTGQNVGAIRRMAKVTGRGAMDVERAEQNLRNVGRAGLESNEAGSPIVGWASKSSEMAPAAAGKAEFYGKKIGEVGAAVDATHPEGAVDFKSIADKITDYAATIPETETGKRIQNRLLEEAANFEKKGKTTFADAQAYKNQFQYKPQDQDALISNQDVTNKVRSIITKEMDNTAETVAKNPSAPAEVGKYGEYKQGYGAMKNAAEATSEQAKRELARGFISPSSTGTGLAAAMIYGGTHGGAGMGTVLAGATAAAANKLARERGSAFAARSMDALSKIAASTPDVLGRYKDMLEAAAKRTPEALMVTHHVLMNNDPKYRQIIEGASNGNSTNPTP